MIYIYGISHVIRNWDLVTESLYMLLRNGLWGDPRVHPITWEQTTIQQHHKSRQANNKIPVAHTHHMSFCLRHLHTCHLSTLSFSLFAARSSSLRLLLTPFPSCVFGNSFPFLNSQNQEAVHSRFVPRGGRREVGKREMKRGKRKKQHAGRRDARGV